MLDGSEDIDALFDRVRTRAKVVDPVADRPWGDRTFIIRDPDSYEVEVAKEQSQG